MAMLVAGDHMTDVPPKITYASVVFRKTVRIDLKMAALNGMIVKTADIMNAYIEAPIREKVYAILRPDFGKSSFNRSGAYLQNHLAKCMKFMEYKPCLTDTDLWMRRMKISSYGFKQYEYIIINVDDVLAISDDQTEALQNIDR